MHFWLDRELNNVKTELVRAIGEDGLLLDQLLNLDRKVALHLIKCAVRKHKRREDRRSYISAGVANFLRKNELTLRLERFEDLDSALAPEEWRDISPVEQHKFRRAWLDAEIELNVLEGVAMPFQLLRLRFGQEQAQRLWAKVLGSVDLRTEAGSRRANRLLLHAAKARNPHRYIRAALRNEKR